MFFRQIYTDALAQASYLVGCQQTGEALVVDPTRDLDRYVDLAAREGLRITAVTETHIHADFVSGARALAARTGARLYLSGAGPADWQYAYAAGSGATLVHDGDTITVGTLRLDVLHTPGHTPEHLSFLLTDPAAAGPMGIFTGDFVFVGDVGRPDLLEKAAGLAGTMEAGARQLYRSLQRFVTLPEYLQVWPGHGAGSACGKALSAIPQSTVGYERRANWALAPLTEEQFVARVLAGQPDPPPYFARMKSLNKKGPEPVEIRAPVRLSARALETALSDGAALVVDIRPASEYAAGHIPDTLNLPLGPAFLTWAGWLLPYDRPIALIATPEDAVAAARLLALIGLDSVIGYGTPDVCPAWPLARGQRLAPADVWRMREAGRVYIVDVRTSTEHAAGHIPGSLNIPLGHLPARLAEIPTDGRVVVHCQGGLRSAIAASLLTAHGHRDVVDLDGGFAAWQRAGLPVEDSAVVQAPAPVAAGV